MSERWRPTQSIPPLTGIPAGDTVIISDKPRATLVRIAADHETTAGGHRKKLSRSEMVLLAREVCLAMGWEWSRR